MEEIKKLIEENQLEEAIQQLDAYIRLHADDDNAWYLRGNAYRKRGNWREALNNYLQAIELNPESPAVSAHRMLMDIMNYRNTENLNP